MEHEVYERLIATTEDLLTMARNQEDIESGEEASTEEEEVVDEDDVGSLTTATREAVVSYAVQSAYIQLLTLLFSRVRLSRIQL